MRSQIQAVIDEYADKLAKVKSNKDLSATGREKAIQRIQAEKAEALKAFVPALRKQAVAAGLEAKRQQDCAWASGQMDADKMDYARLTYEANAAKSQVKRSGGDILQVAQTWQQVKNSGDKYKIRAFIDTVPAELDTNENDQNARELMADMNRYSGIFEKSAMTAEYEGKAQEQLAELGSLQELAGMLDAELYTNANSYSKPVTRKRILKGMNFTDDGKIELAFKQGDKEKPEDVFYRLEQEHAEELAAIQELGVKFGVPMTEADLD